MKVAVAWVTCILFMWLSKFRLRHRNKGGEKRRYWDLIFEVLSGTTQVWVFISLGGRREG